MTPQTIKRWCWIHKWTSLICTLFLLMLCITGLPLIFYHEIEEALGNSIEAPEMPAGTPKAAVDKALAAAKDFMPGWVPQYVSWDEDHPNEVFVSMATAPDSPGTDNRRLVADARTGEVLGENKFQNTVMYFLFRLHVDMFAGLPGMLFLGFMGLLFVIAIVSGVVIYAPFMRRLDFGTVRRNKATRVKWLDLHNLLGVVTLAWALLVGATGVVNTLADVVFAAWRNGQLAEMVAPYAGQPPQAPTASLQSAIEAAEAAAPGMTPSFVAFPQSPFSSGHHYGIFLHGDTPLTSRLLKPALVDSSTGELTDMRDLPWYAKTLLISQPLHFGDYGGMPLKILWAILDIVTIIVLGSGLYLWLARRKVTSDVKVAELERGYGSSAPQPAE
ncbi:PepSY-associated TM helix domain-containing protein [Methyloligella sp. 2.7D]|uniref:PepSY-associated TM helix domain-containing protein n=1 Tax=unclassified Methyloligella TaxID=2625955 RepID=UPI00157D44E3|nr:PepSY-associated TM helix domain-containing protein [Methyloligella sp. GL2]QKP77648.1 PepSY domain-containing protein [Methyloligella sp. GL2]